MSGSTKRRLFRQAREKRDGSTFVALPVIMIRSEQFIALSVHAIKLLIDLLAQYRFSNNGDLTCTWSVMQRRGWKSRETLGKALDELIDSGFVAQTRQGGRHMASLYGVTFYEMDENRKLDILRAADFPRSLWARTAPGAGSQRRKQYPAERANSSASKGKGGPTGADRRHARRVNPELISPPSVPIPSCRVVSDPLVVSMGAGSSQSMTRPACTSKELPSALAPHAHLVGATHAEESLASARPARPTTAAGTLIDPVPGPSRGPENEFDRAYAATMRRIARSLRRR